MWLARSAREKCWAGSTGLATLLSWYHTHPRGLDFRCHADCQSSAGVAGPVPCRLAGVRVALPSKDPGGVVSPNRGAWFGAEVPGYYQASRKHCLSRDHEGRLQARFLRLAGLKDSDFRYLSIGNARVQAGLKHASGVLPQLP